MRPAGRTLAMSGMDEQGSFHLYYLCLQHVMTLCELKLSAAYCDLIQQVPFKYTVKPVLTATSE